MLTAEQLTSFVTAASLGSFSAAARAMGKSQATVSEAIAKLEHELGTALFDRSGKYPQLTERGRLLREHAQKLLSGSDQLMAFADSVSLQPEEQLHLGLDPLVPMPVIEPCLEKTGSAFPHIQLRLTRDPAPDLLQRLLSGELSLVISAANLANREAQPPALNSCALVTIQLCYVCAADSALNSHTPVERQQLAATRQICCDAIRCANAHGLRWHADTLEDMLRLVSQDLGWAIVPLSLYQEHEAQGKLARFDVVPEPASEPMEITLRLWSANSIMPDPAQAFLHQQLLRIR